MLGWQYRKSATECHRHMLDSELWTDVCFEVGGPAGGQTGGLAGGLSGAWAGGQGQDEEVPERRGEPAGRTVLVRAHRCMLAARSTVFEQMLNETLDVSTRHRSVTGGAESIRVTDIQSGVFREVLRYIYTDDVFVTTDTAPLLIYAAQKYLLSGLLEKCLKFLQDTLTVENVCAIIDHCVELGEIELKDHCIKFICANVDAVVKTEAFLNLSSNALEFIIGNDEFEFKSQSEFDVHEACIAWARAQVMKEKKNPTDQQLRKTLGNVLYRIRYPLFKSDDFAKLMGKSRLLDEGEKSTIYYYTITKEKEEDFEFDCDVRKSSVEPVVDGVVERFTNVIDRNWDSSGDAITFVPDKNIVLLGVGLFKSEGCDPEINVYLDDVMHSATFTSVRKVPKIDHVVLESPVEVKAGTKCTVVAVSEDNACSYSLCGVGGRARCIVNNVMFTFSNNKNDEFESFASSVEEGQLPTLYFRVKI